MRSIYATACGWSLKETKVVEEVWRHADFQSKLNGVHRIRTIFEKIAAEQEKLGYEKMWLQCRRAIEVKNEITLIHIPLPVSVLLQVYLTTSSIYASLASCCF